MKIVYKGGEAEIVEKKSRFIATVHPVDNEEDALAFIAAMKKKYWDARHNCFAYVIGERQELQRCSDDGEPQGTAGRPMLEVLLGEDVHNMVVVVTRYFGGVLLGTGGLVRAYSKSVQEGLRNSTIIEKQKGVRLAIRTDYSGIGRIQYLLGSRGLPILDSEYTDAVLLRTVVPKEQASALQEAVTEATAGRAEFPEEAAVCYAMVDGEGVCFKMIKQFQDSIKMKRQTEKTRFTFMETNHMACRASIGVFDSGVGGLTVAREIMRNLPKEHIVYFGDTARVPYGSKSKVTIVRYARQIIHFLRTQDVKAIVIACNTASALALDEVEKDLDIPIIGVIRPGARVAVGATRNRRIGVIGTESTINSHMYQKLIYEEDPTITVYEKACPLFCPLVEEGWLKDPVTKEVARRYLDELLENDIDSLILGCTHYPLLRSLIREIVGEKITLVNPAYETAKELGELLKREGLENPDEPADPPATEPYRFFVSDMAEKFGHFANSILPYDIETIQKINIEEY